MDSDSRRDSLPTPSPHIRRSQDSPARWKGEGASGKDKEDVGKVAPHCQPGEKPDPANAQLTLWQEGTLPGDAGPFVSEGGMESLGHMFKERP